MIHYLDPTSEVYLIKTVEKQLISEHMSSILSKGLDNLLEQDKKVELKLMYNLLGKVTGGHAELKGKMCDYVKNRGRVIVVNPEKDKTMYVIQPRDTAQARKFKKSWAKKFVKSNRKSISRIFSLHYIFHKNCFPESEKK